MTKVRIGKSLKNLLISKPRRLAIRALSSQKLANRMKNALLLPIKKTGILPSGKKPPNKSIPYRELLKTLQRNNKTSRFYRRNFSNLTFSGAFLNSFKATIKVTRKMATFSTFPTGLHKPYKKSKNHTNYSSEEPVKNSLIGEGLVSRGYDYTEISDKNKQKLVKSMKSAILKEFKLNLKRK